MNEDSIQKIIRGLEACATCTFVLMSYTSLPCTQRSKSATKCQNFAEFPAYKKFLNKIRKGLNHHLVHLLSESAEGDSKAWMTHLENMKHVLNAGPRNPNAAPYLHLSLLNSETLPEEIHHSFILLDDVALHKSVASDALYREELKNLLGSLRNVAKGLKASYVREEMLSATYNRSMKKRAKRISKLICFSPKGDHYGTIAALLRASEELSNTQRAPSFFRVISTSIQEVANSAKHIVFLCKNDAECAKDMKCESRGEAKHPLQPRLTLNAGLTGHDMEHKKQPMSRPPFIPHKSPDVSEKARTGGA